MQRGGGDVYTEYYMAKVPFFFEVLIERRRIKSESLEWAPSDNFWHTPHAKRISESTNEIYL
jgi:hypothetical protein